MTEAVQAQYSVLNKLKSIHEQSARIQAELDKIPGEVKELENGLEGRKLQFDAAKEVLEGHKKQLREAELDLKSFDDKINKAQEKLMEVKTNEAYAAANREIDGQKAEKMKLEDRILELMTKLEGETAVFKDAENTYKEFETLFKKEKADLDALAARLNSEMAELQKKKAGLSEGLDSAISGLYKRVSEQVKAPIVEAVSAMCSGCRIRLRPQLYNQILAGTDVYQCPSCNRILIANQSSPSPEA